jgi:tetratricopeptide (TPR) repeat protein/DNA-binding CsgD family transcriptional regulator
MDTDLVLKSLPYELPSELILTLESSSDISSQLHIIRNWVHTNDEITHEQRLKWHKPLLYIAKTNNLLVDEAISLTNIAKIYDRLGEFDSSLKAINKVQQIWQELSADDNKYYHELIIAYCDQAVTLRLQNHFDLALSTLYKGYELIKYDGLKNKETFLILLSDLGIIYKEISDYPAALNSFNESLKLINESSNPEDYIQNKILCHINIGNVQKESGSLDLACMEFDTAINVILDQNNYFQYFIIANINLGQTLIELKKYEDALLIYDKAMKVCKKSGSEMDLGFILILMAEAHFNLSNMPEFDKYISKGKLLIDKASYPKDKLFFNSLLSRSYILKGNNKKGISLLEQSLDICKKHKMSKHLLKTYKALSNAYRDVEDIGNAFKYSEKYIKLRNTVDKKQHQLFLNEKQQALNRMQEKIKMIREKEKKRILEVELQYKKRELISRKLHSVSSRGFLEGLYKNLKDMPQLDKHLQNIIQDCENQILNSSSWNDYLNTYEESDPEFMQNLRILSDKLSSMEIRVCSLIHLGLDNYEIAKFMSVSKRSIEQHRYRIKKKLEIDKNLTEYIFSLS